MYKHPTFISTPAENLCAWFQREGRDLPWRHIQDPYLIWVSEIILQQTRIAQGTAYYERFIERFPTLQALAAANQDEVLKAWEGLGYYTRARALHHTAQYIATELSGKFPETYLELILFKGIGPYTARAISSLAFGEQVAVLDGNVFRVLSRYFGDAFPINGPSARNHYQPLADALMGNTPATCFNQAIMDLGALVCSPGNPICDKCPLVDTCEAYGQGLTSILPKKVGKAANKSRYFDFQLIKNREGLFAIRQRKAKGYWQGLWELPNIEVRNFIQAPDGPVRATLTHEFTHFTMQIRVVELPIESLPQSEGIRFITAEKIPNFAFPRAILKIFELIGALDSAPEGLFAGLVQP